MAPKRIYVFGEMMNDFGEEYYYSVRSYDPENDNWTAGADMLTGRGGLGVAVVNDLIYVIGGETANGIPFSADPPSLKKYATNEQYTPIGYGTIQPATTEPFPTVPVVVASVAVVAVASVGLLVYFKKRKH
jgi:hypothetical protein